MRYIHFFFILTLLLGCTNENSEMEMDWEKEGEQNRSKIVLFLGDSLTAGYGLEKECAYPYLLQQKWQQLNIPYITRNGGTSGATSADILQNLSWSLSQDVVTVFLCIGANDGLRGWNVDISKKNIENIVVECQNRKIPIVLAGMMLPPNYGKEYREKFANMYREIAQKYQIKYMPFLLEGVAGNHSLNLEDAIHPNEKGHQIIAENVHQFFIKEKLLP